MVLVQMMMVKYKCEQIEDKIFHHEESSLIVMISLTWNILMVINDEASWWKYAEILLTNTRHSGQRGKVFPPQILFAKFQRSLNSFWAYIIQEMSFASFQWICHIYSSWFCICIWHRMDLRLCKYDKNSFSGIGRISVGLKSARCWDFPVTKKRQPQKRRKRRKKKRGKRRREEKEDDGERDLVRTGLA